MSFSKHAFPPFPYKILLLSKKVKFRFVYLGKNLCNLYVHKKLHIRNYYGYLEFSNGFRVIAALKFENC